MARSYLYQGRDTEALSPQERMLEKLYDRLDTPNNRLTATQFFQTPEAAQLLDQLHGALTDRLPPGSQIISQTPGKITYRDPEGYEHNLIRKPDGQFTETTNRPAILPNQQQQDFTRQLQGQLQQGLSASPTLAQLDPETARALQAIAQAEETATNQQLGEIEGQLLARLFGSGVQRSSIATGAGAQFAQKAGLVRQQQQSDAANRELSIRNLLTTLGQQQRELQAGLYSNLTGQANTRDIAGAGLALDRARLDESMRQFDLDNYLKGLQTQLQREELDAANSPFNKIVRGVQAAGSLGQGVGTAINAYDALRRRF